MELTREAVGVATDASAGGWMDAYHLASRSFKPIFVLIIRTAIVALVSWPLLLVAVLTQERLAAPPPSAVVALFMSLVFAKAALLILLGRVWARVGP
jgi:hypothetical protein